MLNRITDVNFSTFGPKLYKILLIGNAFINSSWLNGIASPSPKFAYFRTDYTNKIWNIRRGGRKY